MNDKYQDPDLNFLKGSVSSSFDIDYGSPKDFKSKFKDYTENSFSALHLHILSKNFKIFKEL